MFAEHFTNHIHAPRQNHSLGLSSPHGHRTCHVPFHPVEQVQQPLGYHTDLSMPVHITDHRARTACAWSLHTVAFRVAHHLVRDQTFHAVRAAETNPGTSDRRAARLQLLNHEQSPWRGKSSNAGVSGFSGLHCRAQVGPKRRRHQTLLSSPKARRA